MVAAAVVVVVAAVVVVKTAHTLARATSVAS